MTTNDEHDHAHDNPLPHHRRIHHERTSAGHNGKYNKFETRRSTFSKW